MFDVTKIIPQAKRRKLPLARWVFSFQNLIEIKPKKIGEKTYRFCWAVRIGEHDVDVLAVLF